MEGGLVREYAETAIAEVVALAVALGPDIGVEEGLGALAVARVYPMNAHPPFFVSGGGIVIAAS